MTLVRALSVLVLLSTALLDADADEPQLALAATIVPPVVPLAESSRSDGDVMVRVRLENVSRAPVSICAPWPSTSVVSIRRSKKVLLPQTGGVDMLDPLPRTGFPPVELQPGQALVFELPLLRRVVSTDEDRVIRFDVRRPGHYLATVRYACDGHAPVETTAPFRVVPRATR